MKALLEVKQNEEMTITNYWRKVTQRFQLLNLNHHGMFVDTFLNRIANHQLREEVIKLDPKNPRECLTNACAAWSHLIKQQQQRREETIDQDEFPVDRGPN